MKPSGQKGTCLHLVVRSSFSALANCRSHVAEGDSVLFLDDGVMHAIVGSDDISKTSLDECYFSSADLQARGLETIVSDSDSLLSDQEIATLILAHDFCLTWK